MNRALILGLVATLTVMPLKGSAQQTGRTGVLSTQARQELAARIGERQGRVIIGFKSPAMPRGVSPAGARLVSRASARAAAADLRSRGIDVRREFDLIPAVAARVDTQDLAQLLTDPRIDYVEPDNLSELTAVNTASFERLPQTTQRTPWGITRIAAPDAWSTTRGAGVKIGIIDTGIDEDHPDLEVIGGINTVTGGTTRADWNDESAICITHGTHVAGSAAALDNAEGVVGVAPDADLYALRVFDPENAGLAQCGAWDSDIIVAYEWAVDNDLDVINLSLGGPFPSFAAGDAAAATHLAGVTIIASAGNSYSANPGSLVGFPGAYPHTIAVAAAHSADGIASFSKKGLEVDIAAPGVNVESTWGGGGYAFNQGTSMAAPHVAGVAALVVAGNPSLSPDEIRSVLASTAYDLGLPQPHQGAGLVIADAAVDAVASGAAALALDAPRILLTVPSGGATQSTTIELRNVGAPGAVSWTATADQPWLTVTASGSATDVTPSTIQIDADPTGLASHVHRGSITITATAANAPLVVPVRFAVTEHLVLHPDSVVSGYYPAGTRARITFDGTAGDRIDVVARPGGRHMVRLLMPDGVTPFAIDDRAQTIDLYVWPESYILGAQLPVTGRYFAEMGYADDSREWTFDLRARPADGVLTVGYDAYWVQSARYMRPVRVEEGGSDGIAVDTVYNLSGFGSVDFVATAPAGITLSASSGTVTESLPIELRVASAGLVAGANPSPDTVEYSDPDEWLLQGGSFTTWERSVPVHVYSSGMETIAVDTDAVREFGGVAGTAAGEAIVLFDLTDLHVVRADGSLGPTITLADRICGDVAVSPDRSWLGVACVGRRLVEIGETGTTREIAALSILPEHLTAGLDFLYGSVCAENRIYRIDRATGIAEPFGPTVDCPVGLHFSLSRNTLYAATGGTTPQGIRAIAADGTDLGTIATEIDQAAAITEGASGLLYVGDHHAGLWSVDPDGGGSATQLAWWPGPHSDLMGLTVLDGVLVSSAGVPITPTFNFSYYAQSEIYTYPVSDRPVRSLFARVGGPTQFATVGDTILVHVVADPAFATEALGSFSAELGWSPTDLGFGGLAAGPFSTGGTFDADSSMAGTGTVSALGTASPAVSDTTTLLTLGLEILPGTPLGEPIPLSMTFSEMDGPTTDLLPELIQRQASLCVSYRFGDPTQDGTIGSGDAVQVLRELVDLPLDAGVDIDLGDVDGNEVLGIADAIAILRYAVALPTPAANLGLSNAGVCQ